MIRRRQTSPLSEDQRVEQNREPEHSLTRFLKSKSSVRARLRQTLNLIKLLFVFFDLLGGSFGLFFPLRFSFRVDYDGLGIDSA